jgi:hypothetical protein
MATMIKSSEKMSIERNAVMAICTRKLCAPKKKVNVIVKTAPQNQPDDAGHGGDEPDAA